MADIDFEDIDPDGILAWEKIKGLSSFGKTYKAKWNDCAVIVKKFKVHREKTNITNELNKLRRIKHENIIQVYGSCISRSDVLLLTEYANGGSLHEFLHREPKSSYSKAQAVNWAFQCAQAVAYLHSMEPKILHRDLKPRNLLLTNDNKTIKICDFGVVTELRYLMTGYEGALTYMAPELFMGEKYTEECDVYSWAIIFWEILARERPYKHLEARVAIPYLTAMECQRPRPLDNCPEPIVSLINKCWNQDPTSRPSMTKVVKEFHTFRNIFPKFESEEANTIYETNIEKNIKLEKMKFGMSKPKKVTVAKFDPERHVGQPGVIGFSTMDKSTQKLQVQQEKTEQGPSKEVEGT